MNLPTNVCMTEKEKMVFENIVFNEMTQLNGARPTCREDRKRMICWTDCVELGKHDLDKKTIAGCMGTLVQKGLITTTGSKREDMCGPTELGFDLYFGRDLK